MVEYIKKIFNNILYLRSRGMDLTTEVPKVFTQKRNSAAADMDPEEYDLHQEIARSSFADMLHDKERNQKYQQALQLAIDKMHKAGKEANVLDIGTGTGLLSIMAARCGADSIVACEAFMPMAECCLKVLADNGVADKVIVIPKRSTELTVGEDGDMKQRANILVTEVFDTELIGEGALSTFTHAHMYLLDEDCIVVPDSAIMYAQVVECPFLQKRNKLNDLLDEDQDEVVLKVPRKIKNCAGAPSVYDLQLSRMPRHMVMEISEQLPVFYYDFSGRTSLHMKRTVKQSFVATCTDYEECQMVFVWWELSMDPQGKIMLSCAPWWTHPDADSYCQDPQVTIPWRDHWMQGVYYLPKITKLREPCQASLVSCQDEYSLWFHVYDGFNLFGGYQRPACECGMHMAFSRTHLGYLNDTRRSKKFLSEIRVELSNLTNPIVLDLNGSSFLGLAAAKMGAKKVYIYETARLNIGFLNDYIRENDLWNVELITYLSDEILSKVSMVVCDPNYSDAVMPWENLKFPYLLLKYRSKLRKDVTIIPQKCEFWAMPVEFAHLHKIRVAVGECEGVKMRAFDELIERSRKVSDAEIEAQPLWEYASTCRGNERKILEMDMRDLKVTYSTDETHPLADEEMEEGPLNGFVMYAVWILEQKGISGGPVCEQWPMLGQSVGWDPHTKQAIKILNKEQKVNATDKWSFKVDCDLAKGEFDISVDLVPPPPET